MIIIYVYRILHNLQISLLNQNFFRCFHYAQMERGPVQLNIPRQGWEIRKKSAPRSDRFVYMLII